MVTDFKQKWNIKYQVLQYQFLHKHRLYTKESLLFYIGHFHKKIQISTLSFSLNTKNISGVSLVLVLWYKKES